MRSFEHCLFLYLPMILATGSMMWISITFGGLLVAVAAVLMWLAAPDQQADNARRRGAEEVAFFGRQYRRRKRLNWLIAITGLAIITSPLIRLPLLRLAFWGGVALVVLWILFLALLDLVASYLFLQSLRTRQQATRMAIESQYKQLRDQRRDAAPTGGEDEAGDDGRQPPLD